MIKKEHLTKFLLALIVIFAYKCQTDLHLFHSEHKSYIRSDITFEKFKSETGLLNFSSNIKITNNIINDSKYSDESINLTDFDINTDIIKSVQFQQKTTYTFQIEPKNIITENNFNLILYKTNNVWEQKIIEMKPIESNSINLSVYPFSATRLLFESTPSTFRCIYTTYNTCPWPGDCTGAGGSCDNCDACVSTGVSCHPESIGGNYSGGGGNGFVTPHDLETVPSSDAIVYEPNLDSNSLNLAGQPQTKTPCSELKKNVTNNAIQQTLSILKGQSSGQAEHGNYISEFTNSAGSTGLSYPVIPQNPNNPYEINILDGLTTGKVIGAMHCHTDPETTGMIPMFSAADFGALFAIAYSHIPNNNAQKNYSEYTVMLSVGSGQYALKFKNFSYSYDNFNDKFPIFQKNLEKENEKLKSMALNSLLMATFLKNMNKYFGNEVGLFKATESIDLNGMSIITGWNEQTLNTNGDIIPIDCP